MWLTSNGGRAIIGFPQTQLGALAPPPCDPTALVGAIEHATDPASEKSSESEESLRREGARAVSPEAHAIG